MKMDLVVKKTFVIKLNEAQYVAMRNALGAYVQYVGESRAPIPTPANMALRKEIIDLNAEFADIERMIEVQSERNPFKEIIK